MLSACFTLSEGEPNLALVRFLFLKQMMKFLIKNESRLRMFRLVHEKNSRQPSACVAYNVQNRGMTTVAAIHMMILRGTPMRTKSMKR